MWAGAINRRPELALEALKVIAFWAEIEGDLATILAAMLKADVATGVAMYEALSMGEGRRAALSAAARQALPEWQAKLFEAIQFATSPSRKQRNAFAHNLWATADDLPDAILLMDPKVVSKVTVSHRQRHVVDGQNVIRPIDLDRSAIQVYKKSDMERAKADAVKALGWYEMFYNVITVRATDQGRDTALTLLLKESQIQSAIRKMFPESGPPIPPELFPPAPDEPDSKA